MFDIDHFKRVNDEHGHELGDHVLQAVAAEAMTNDAVVGRLGGEEFCLLARCSLAEAIDMADDLRHSIRSLRFGRDRQITVTSSFGVAEWEPGDTIDQVLRRADMALYEAKKSGRDRVVAADTFAVTKDHDMWRNVVRTSKLRKQ